MILVRMYNYPRSHHGDLGQGGANPATSLGSPSTPRGDPLITVCGGSGPPCRVRRQARIRMACCSRLANIGHGSREKGDPVEAQNNLREETRFPAVVSEPL